MRSPEEMAVEWALSLGVIYLGLLTLVQIVADPHPLAVSFLALVGAAGGVLLYRWLIRHFLTDLDAPETPRD